MQEKEKDEKRKQSDKKMCSFGSITAGKMYSLSEYETCGDDMFNTSEEFLEILCFREDNEESSEETTGCQASVYAEFDEYTRSENFIEIFRFRYFARHVEFSRTRKNRRKSRL